MTATKKTVPFPGKIDFDAKTSEVVTRLLQKFPHLRDDDNALIANIWLNEAKNIPEGLNTPSVRKFLACYAQNMLTNAETIRRIRQKIQEGNALLRGDTYGLRQRKAGHVKKMITGD